jgi:hypothetical protein
MTRRRVILFSLVALVAAIAIIYLCIPKEPRYQGRSLSSWIDNDVNSYRSVPGSAKWQAADNAVVQIGTNAIPTLLRWASAKDSELKVEIMSRVNPRVPTRFQIRTDRQRQREAILGFQCLGAIAKPAWPVFVQWTTNSDPDRRLIGLNCLTATCVDKETLLPILSRLIKDSDGRIRLPAEQCLLTQYPHAREASEVNKFPILIETSNATNREDVRYFIFIK